MILNKIPLIKKDSCRGIFFYRKFYIDSRYLKNVNHYDVSDGINTYYVIKFKLEISVLKG